MSDGPNQAPQPSAAAAASGTLSVEQVEERQRTGAKVEAQSLSYGDGVWYPAKILQVAPDTGRVKVHFLGFEEDEDEWLPVQSLRPFQDPPNSGAKVATLPLSELLKAFRSSEQLVQKVQERTGLPKEELERMKEEDLQAEFDALGLQMSSTLSFEEFAKTLAKLQGLRRIHDQKRDRASPNTGQAPEPIQTVESPAAVRSLTPKQQELHAAQEQAEALADNLDLPKHEGSNNGAEVEALQKEVRSVSEKVDSSLEQVDFCKEQTEQAVGMVARLAETLQKQAMDSYNMEQALVKSESKLIGLQASSVSVLEGRLRAFVKAELEGAILTALSDIRVLPRLKALESDHRKLCDAVEEDTQWLRDAVEAISESLGLDLANVDAEGGVKSLSPSVQGQAMSPGSPSDVTMGGLTSPEGRNAALFAQLDVDGDGDVSLREFHAAKVGEGQRKADVFDKLDADLDGRVSREEFASATVSAARPPRRSSGESIEAKGPSREAEPAPAEPSGEEPGSTDDHPLFAAVLSEDPARALVLLRSATPQQLHAQDQEGCTALHRASALPGLVKVRGVLLDKGGAQLASVRDLHMRTALHHSALAGCVEACQQLLDAPCFHDADRRALHGRTALHLAAEYGHAEVLRVLLNHTAFKAIDAADDYGHTGLHHAAMQGHPAACQALLEHPRFIAEGARDKDGWTALHWAASGGYATVCKLLLANPSFTEVAARTARGWTALHLGAAHGFEEVCHALLCHQRFTVVTAQDCVGRNALHAAAEAGHRNVCKLFTGHESFRVLATTKDYFGHTASDLAVGGAVEEL